MAQFFIKTVFTTAIIEAEEMMDAIEIFDEDWCPIDDVNEITVIRVMGRETSG